MSISGIASAGLVRSPFSPGEAFTSPASDATGGVGALDGGSFSQFLDLHIAGLRSRLLDSLASAAFADRTAGNAGGAACLQAFDSGFRVTGTDIRSIGDLSPDGRNALLFDPESAYRMMSVINYSELAYKAQFAGLSEMKGSLADLQQDAAALATISATTGDENIRSALQIFVDRYNDWVLRFDADMQSGGSLAGVEAAKVSRHEMEQSVNNMFNGARDGLHGLHDLGLSIDPHTGLATLDGARLDVVLAGNSLGVVNTVKEFAANFARSAELLNSAGNFILNRLNRLDNVIRYIDANTPALQAEFGLGDSASPSSRTAKALAAYDRIRSFVN